jgi:hypothetical protein
MRPIKTVCPAALLVPGNPAGIKANSKLAGSFGIACKRPLPGGRDGMAGGGAHALCLTGSSP